MVSGGQGPGDITGLGVIRWLYLGPESVITYHNVVFHDCPRGALSARHLHSMIPEAASFFTPALIELRALWNHFHVCKAAETECGI